MAYLISKHVILSSILPKNILKFRISKMNESWQIWNKIQSFVIFQNWKETVSLDILYKINSTYKKNFALYVKGYDFLFFDTPYDLKTSLSSEFNKWYDWLERFLGITSISEEDENKSIPPSYKALNDAFKRSNPSYSLEKIKQEELFKTQNEKCFTEDMINKINLWFTWKNKYSDEQQKNITILKRYADTNPEKNNILLSMFLSLEKSIWFLQPNQIIFEIIWKKDIYKSNKTNENQTFQYIVKTNITNSNQLKEAIDKYIMQWNWGVWTLIPDENLWKDVKKISVVLYSTD